MMEAPTCAPVLMECGDGWGTTGERLSDETEWSSADQCSSSITYFSSSSDSGSGPIAHSTAEVESAEHDSPACRAAESLSCLSLDETPSTLQCTENGEDVNCANCPKDNAYDGWGSSAESQAMSELILSQCCDSVCHCATTKTTLCSNEHTVESNNSPSKDNHISPSGKDVTSDKVENGANVECDLVDTYTVASERCRHATSDSDYTATSCDVVFSNGIEYRPYGCERHLKEIMELVSRDLSEPYSIYTYRYFIYNWPNLCFRALDVDRCVGAIVCKLHVYQDNLIRGYIAMLAVDKEYRRRGIGTQLVLCAVKAMMDDKCDDVVLEAEIDNSAALRLYENLGFIRDKRLHKYYLNGHDAFRLHLLLD